MGQKASVFDILKGGDGQAGETSAPRPPQVMLDIRFEDGNRRSLAYAYLLGVELDLSGKLVLQFHRHKVTIQGRGLTPVYQALLSHAQDALVEDGKAFEQAEDGATAILSVSVEDVGG